MHGVISFGMLRDSRPQDTLKPSRGKYPGGSANLQGHPDMGLSDFTTLTFDCYGTLIDWESGLLEAFTPWRVRTGIAVAESALLEAFGRAESAAQAHAPATLYPDILARVMREMSAHWKAPATDDEVAAFASSVGDWPAFPDTPAALAYLKRHYRLVILSNIDRASFALSNCRLGVEFDYVFTAQDIGSYKPDPRNFEYALRALGAAGIAAHEVLHVAQSLFHDHVPAKSLGLKTLWVNRRKGRPGHGATPPAEATPDWEVETLAEMVDLHWRARD